MEESTPTVFELRCEVQQYAWGKLGLDSEVARLSQESNPDFKVSPTEPYAELWMGAHPKAPSRIPSLGGRSLLEYVKANSQVLGDKVVERFNGELPYLFKVLSVNKSLSIQAHPNKTHAEKLYAERPDIYKDPNHKPEMAIALTPFEGLCGFRPINEIKNFLENVLEFRAVIGERAAGQLLACSGNSEGTSAALKSCFENVMKCDAITREKNLSVLISRVEKMGKDNKEFNDTLGELLLRLHSQFPGDVGCFVIYFLNQIKLLPGEAMYLGANEPHAYLDGNCIECMACSDNVVRAGLTPKLIDIPTLCEMLNYTPATAESKKFSAVQDKKDSYLTTYNPPVDDFAVERVCVPKNISTYSFVAKQSASILLFIEGRGSSINPGGFEIKPGMVLFLSANSSLDIKIEGTGLLAFRSLCIL